MGRHHPGPVQSFMAHFTELGIVVLGAIWTLMFWRARRGPARPGRVPKIF